jgi:DNA-binding XRE family transcriptional regulator
VFIKYDKLPAMRVRGRRGVSPIGISTEQARRHRAARSATYRREQERLADFERVARLLIKYRTELNLTQKELADRVGTSHSAISRIESGHHKTNLDTLLRIAHALNHRLVIGFETRPSQRRVRELIAV